EPTNELEMQDYLFRRVESLLGNLANARNQAQGNIRKTQGKQKAHHDQKYRIETYQIGDKVILHETSLSTSYSSKLEPSFTGPYNIHEVCGNGSYKLRTIKTLPNNKPLKSERVLKKRIHGNQLKKYITAPTTINPPLYKNSDF
ncbi:20894_t:CDS:1, partial [Gigaspora rosea]